MSVDLGYFFSTRIPKLVVSGGRRGADNQAEYKSDPKSHVVPCPGELYRSSEPPATPSWASVLENASPRTKIQLLRYQQPEPLPETHIRDLHKIGMNHICFAVDDVEAEVAKLKARGFKTRNEIMDFHSRKLVFVEGPEGVTVELAEWH